MRVLLDYRAALRQRSGVGEYTHELARALLARARARAGPGAFELSLFSSSLRDRLRVDARLDGARAIDRRVPVRVLNFAWHRLEQPTAEWLTGGTYDVAHSMHPLLMPTRHAAQVVTIHDLNFLTHPERTRAEIRRDYPALVRQHAHRADRIVAVSAFTASEIVRLLDVPPERISVCIAGAPSWPARTEPPADGGYLLFFGTLEPRKNVGVLLDAYERLVQRRHDIPPLVLAGRATAEAAPWLERIARSPLAGRARHIGYVAPEDRQALYAGATLLVQPSFEEGFGLPVLEAMTVGVPVVAANRGALPEVLGTAGLLVDATDPDAFAAAIERFIDHPDEARAAVENGLTRAREFSWTRTADQTMTAYDAAIAARAARSSAA
ncbi:MAG: glycosyltransferase family 4 protein [Acidobacteriaceae bacterium]|nr:glycosyltransferase family 4 protein [Acidobacteriaceae bacterium]